MFLREVGVVVEAAHAAIAAPAAVRALRALLLAHEAAVADGRGDPRVCDFSGGVLGHLQVRILLQNSAPCNFSAVVKVYLCAGTLKDSVDFRLSILTSLFIKKSVTSILTKILYCHYHYTIFTYYLVFK